MAKTKQFPPFPIYRQPDEDLATNIRACTMQSWVKPWGNYGGERNDDDHDDHDDGRDVYMEVNTASIIFSTTSSGDATTTTKCPMMVVCMMVTVECEDGQEICAVPMINFPITPRVVFTWSLNAIQWLKWVYQQCAGHPKPKSLFLKLHLNGY